MLARQEMLCSIRKIEAPDRPSFDLIPQLVFLLTDSSSYPAKPLRRPQGEQQESYA